MANDVIVNKYNVTISFTDHEETNYEIPNLYIRYIMLESRYTESLIPVIYLSIALNSELYRLITDEDNVKDGKFLLKIQRYNAYARIPIYTTIVNEAFNYIVSTSNPDYSESLEGASEAADPSYHSLTVALMSMNLMNAVRSEKNEMEGILVSDIFGDVDESTIIGKIFEGFKDYKLKSIITPPTHNNHFDTLIIPPMTSRRELLQFLFDKAPFYDTGFTFFMDYKKAYLLDQNRNGYYIRDEVSSFHHIIFQINGVISDESYEEGYRVENNSIIININPNNSNITRNKAQDKLANRLVVVQEDGDISVVELNVNNSKDSDPKYTFQRGGNATLYKNIIESNNVYVNLSKEDIDGSLFTPNRMYSIQNYVGHEENNGDYILTSKRQIILNNNGVFRSSCELGLRKVGKIKNIGMTDTGDIGTIQNSTMGYRYTKTYSRSKKKKKTTKLVSTAKKGIIPINKNAEVKMLASSQLDPLEQAELNRVPRTSSKNINADYAGPENDANYSKNGITKKSLK